MPGLLGLRGGLGVRAGALRTRVTIEQLTRTASAIGDHTESWSTFAQPWAEIRYTHLLAGLANVRQGGVQTHDYIFVRTRHLTGVTPRMRVKVGTRYLQVTAVRNLGERGRELELVCVEET